MSDIKIDRTKLANYIKQHADVIARNADLDIDVDEHRTFEGISSFIPTVRLQVDEIPLSEVEADQ